MQMQYRIGLKQKRSPSISEVSYRSESDFKVNKTDQNITIESIDPYIGSGFVKTNTAISKYKYSEGYLIGEEPKMSINTFKVDFEKEVFPKYEIKEFLAKYRSFLSEVINGELDPSINLDNSIFLIEVKADSSLHLISSIDYQINSESSRVNLSTPLEMSSKLFTITFPINYSFKKNSDKVLFNFETLLEITPGFYNVLPKKVERIYNIDNSIEGTYRVENRQALKYTSEFNVSFDKSVLDEFLAPPLNVTEIKYSKNDLHPLRDKSFFDYSEGQQYIIYELKNNTYQVAFKLPLQEQEQGLIDLLVSHEEFKRPYSFISNKSAIVIKDYNDTILEEFLIINKDFEESYNTQNDIEGTLNV